MVEHGIQNQPLCLTRGSVVLGDTSTMHSTTSADATKILDEQTAKHVQFVVLDVTILRSAEIEKSAWQILRSMHGDEPSIS